MEETLLQQIKIVNKGQDFVIWISNYSALSVHIGKEGCNEKSKCAFTVSSSTLPQMTPALLRSVGLIF